MTKSFFKLYMNFKYAIEKSILLCYIFVIGVINMLSKEANLIKQKQKKIQNEFENEIYLFWETYPKRIYNINSIIKSIKILRKFMFEYSKELTSYGCTNIPQYENTKKALLEKAKTFLANEIVEYQHEKYQRALKESEENNKKIERRDLLLNDIKSL